MPLNCTQFRYFLPWLLLLTRPSGIFARDHGSIVILSAVGAELLGGLGLGRVYPVHSGCLSSQSFLWIPWNLVHAGQELTIRHRELLAFQVHLFTGLPFTCSCALSSELGTSSGLAGFAACPGLNYGDAWANVRGPGNSFREESSRSLLCWSYPRGRYLLWGRESEFTDDCGRFPKCREWLTVTTLSLWLCFRERICDLTLSVLG